MILCVHGYGVGLTIKPFTTAKSRETCGFEVFLPLIQEGACTMFDWRISRPSSIVDSILHLTPLTLYFKEKKLTESGKLQYRLHQKIESDKIVTITAHSMGCRLVLNMIQNIGLPKSVKQILFVAADIPHKIDLDFVPNNITLISVFCPWDQELPWSQLLNWYIPAGLWGFKEKRVHNIFVPYFKGWDLHHGILKQQELFNTATHLSE